MALYSYEPLTKISRIRSLHHLPDSHDDILVGYLRTVELDLCPSYTCLSYAWDEHSLICSIEINGRKLPITPNLDATLRRSRRCDRRVKIHMHRSDEPR